MTIEPLLFVLDDEAAICRLIGEAAARLGLAAQVFTTGAGLLAAPDLARASVIMLDLSLDDLSGVEMLRLLAERACRAQIVVMSGVDARVLHASYHLGEAQGLTMAGTLPKPFDLDALMRLLKRLTAPGSHAAAQKAARGPGLAQALEDELRHAIETGELRLHYQPKAAFSTGAVVGSEALVRWQHPALGLIGPDLFIPLAEQTGLVVPLTFWVLDEALRQAAAWQGTGMAGQVSINMPARMLADLQLPERVRESLAQRRLPGSVLTIEVTEAEELTDMVSAIDVIARLRLLGVGLAIDDFGTGHSSLLKLQKLPFNELKIDRAFVRDALSDAEARTITELGITLAHRLGMTVVAEGVETREVWDLLAGMGCDVAQGYYLSRALPADALERWHRQQAINLAEANEIAGMRVLVVEDDPIASHVLTTDLENWGVVVVDQASGEREAVEKAERHNPDLVLMDIQLADGDSGIEAARAIRARHPTRVMFMTGRAKPVIDVPSAGVLHKPFMPRQLKRALAASKALFPTSEQVH